MQPVALVTGGAVRIGRQIALRLAATGYTVAIQYNNSAQEAEETLLELEDRGARAQAFKVSLGDTKAVAGLIPAVTGAFGPIACLVNNASVFLDDGFDTFSRDSLELHLGVNVNAPLCLAQAFALQLPAGMPGNIVNIVDQRVWRPNPLFFSYTVSKAALWAATKTMALALAPHIRVNAVGPGPVLRSVHQSQNDFDHECNSVPLRRGTNPEEIADAVMFILNAPAMTGQMIALDGGQHLAWETPDVLTPSLLTKSLLPKSRSPES